MKGGLIDRCDTVTTLKGELFPPDSDYDEGYEAGIKKAIWVVGEWMPTEQQGQRWIPCSERLPEENHTSMFAKLKGTEKWKPGMFVKRSDELPVTVEYEDGTRAVEYGRTHDGEWVFFGSMLPRKVIAWMPLPEPYKTEEIE